MISGYHNPALWILVFLMISIAVIWLFATVLTPYVSAVILAYLLSPLVNILEKSGVGRPIAGILTLIFGISFICGTFLFVLPILIDQAEQLILAFPEIYNRSLKLIEKLLPQFVDKSLTWENKYLNLNEFLKNRGPNIASQLTTYALAVVDLILLVLIVPIITFYLLVDWKKIMVKLGGFIPPSSSNEIYSVLSNIDSLLTGFVRGQLLICASLALFYSVSLSLLGLSYGLLIGVFSGLFSFIPFVGAALGALTALSVAIYQFWTEPVFIGYVALIFGIGQILESNVLTPKLIGSAVRLHPVIIMLAVSIGGTTAGLSGILLAVPVAGIFAVLLRHIGHQYMTSDSFKVREDNE